MLERQARLATLVHERIKAILNCIGSQTSKNHDLCQHVKAEALTESYILIHLHERVASHKDTQTKKKPSNNQFSLCG